MNKVKTIALIFFVFSLSGCLSVTVKHPLAFEHKSIKNISCSIYSTAQMNILNKELTEKENKLKFEKNINKVLQEIKTYTKSSFLQKQKVTFIENIDKKDLSNFNGELYLHLELSGYGSLKEKWKKLLIISGVFEGIFQGIVVGSATSNPWVGVTVTAEEITSEYLTWNGVDWLLGETFAPVTLEGYLYSKKDKKIIWKKSVFITKNKDELKKLSKIDKKNKEKQLFASLHKAETKLFSKLKKYIENNE